MKSTMFIHQANLHQQVGAAWFYLKAEFTSLEVKGLNTILNDHCLAQLFVVSVYCTDIILTP